MSGQFRQNLEELVEGIIQNRGNILWGLFLIIVVVLLAKISLKVVSWATGHTLKSPKYQSDTAAAKRTRTLMTLLRSVARYIIYFIALLIVLSILGMGRAAEQPAHHRGRRQPCHRLWRAEPGQGRHLGDVHDL